ncbi:MAG: DNA-binding response regulator [Verrucomicrobia bacterium]|nr:MAG: DNA-binding response regulator [Verrucomicrobiota bacterium]
MNPESMPSGHCQASRRNLRLVLADDSPVARAAIGSYLKNHPRISSVVTCHDGQEIVAAVLQHAADAALIDVAMPGLDGLEAARIIRSCMPNTAVLMTSVDESLETRRKCAEYGADAFVPKSRFTEQFDQALQSALRAAGAHPRYRESELRRNPNFQDTTVLAAAGCVAIR